MTARPSPLLPPIVGVPLLLALLIAVVYGLLRMRRTALLRAWQAVARELGGIVEGGSGQAPMKARGAYRGYSAFLGQGVSYEDPIPYPHTRGALSIRNPASVVLGLRRKSMLEEYSTRGDVRTVETGDAEFDRSFFVTLSTPEHVSALLPSQVRKELLRYGDVEVYLKGDQIAWRRADTARNTAEMLRLFDAIADMADRLGGLAARDISLTQKLEEEKLIEHGV